MLGWVTKRIEGEGFGDWEGSGGIQIWWCRLGLGFVVPSVDVFFWDGNAAQEKDRKWEKWREKRIENLWKVKNIVAAKACSGDRVISQTWISKPLLLLQGQWMGMALAALAKSEVPFLLNMWQPGGNPNVVSSQNRVPQNWMVGFMFPLTSTVHDRSWASN